VNSPVTVSAAERLRSSELANEIEFLTARSRAIGSAIANELLAGHSLKVRSYSVLALAAADSALTQRDLAEFLRLDPSQIVSIVDELETAGLVRREADPADRRSKVIAITPAGQTRYTAAVASARDAEDRALVALTPDERSQLRELLRKAAFDD
jgi:DNA-binding MarR family transcriptional regulator